jgi:hypothetical protein
LSKVLSIENGLKQEGALWQLPLILALDTHVELLQRHEG